MAYQVLSEKLKLHHQNLGTFNTEEAVTERRRVCVELRTLREADQLMVKNVTEPLPRPTEEQGVAEAEAGTEDDSADEVFTQVPSWQTNHLEFLRTCQGEQQLQKGTKRGQENRKGEFVQRARRTGAAATVRTQSSSTFPARSRSALRVDENRTFYFALLPFIRRSFSLT